MPAAPRVSSGQNASFPSNSLRNKQLHLACCLSAATRAHPQCSQTVAICCCGARGKILLKSGLHPQTTFGNVLKPDTLSERLLVCRTSYAEGTALSQSQVPILELCLACPCMLACACAVIASAFCLQISSLASQVALLHCPARGRVPMKRLMGVQRLSCHAHQFLVVIWARFATGCGSDASSSRQCTSPDCWTGTEISRSLTMTCRHAGLCSTSADATSSVPLAKQPDCNSCQLLLTA